MNKVAEESVLKESLICLKELPGVKEFFAQLNRIELDTCVVVGDECHILLFLYMVDHLELQVLLPLLKEEVKKRLVVLLLSQ